MCRFAYVRKFTKNARRATIEVILRLRTISLLIASEKMIALTTLIGNWNLKLIKSNSEISVGVDKKSEINKKELQESVEASFKLF